MFHFIMELFRLKERAWKPSWKVSRKFISQTSSGGVTINDIIMHYSEKNLPFGGVGESGMGAYHGKEGENRFTVKVDDSNRWH